MRDVAIIVFFIVMLFLALKRPSIGLAIWIWTAFIAPNHLIYGFADGLRFNMIAALAAIAIYTFSSEKPQMAKGGLVFGVLLFFLGTCLSSIFAVYDSPIILRELDRFFRGIVLFVFVLLIADKKQDLQIVCWSIVMSIGFYSGVEGLKYVSSGGGHQIFGPTGTNMRDNNHLALAINMMLPFAVYLLSDIKQKFIRVAFIVFIGVSVLAIVGTNSRGGFVALSIFLFSVFMASKHKLGLIVLATVMAISILSIIPAEYYERISTIKIENAESDGSFAGRVIAWKQSTIIALNNPVTGGGFHAVQTYEVWQKYALQFEKLDFIETPHAFNYPFKAAHSIYFQVLGDQGIFGLLTYLIVFISAGLKAKKLSKLKGLPDEYAWVTVMSKTVYLSLLMFGVGGALLSLAYFEFAFLNIALVIVLNKIANRGLLEEKTKIKSQKSFISSNNVPG